MSVCILNKYNYNWISCKVYNSIELHKTLYVYHSQDAHNTNHFIPAYVIEEINSNKAFLLVSEDGEWSNWQGLKQRLDFSKIIATNNCGIVSANLSFNTKPNSIERDDCPFKIFYYNVIFASTIDSFIPIEKNSISKHYVFLSYRHHPMRSYFYYLLKTHDLLSKGVVSHNRVTSNNVRVRSNTSILEQIRSNLSSQEFHQFIEISKDKLFLESTISDPSYFAPTDGAIEVIAESTYDSGIIFFTEKTFKAILNKNIFLLLGSYQSLLFLQKLGFKTFDRIFDESYDNTVDPVLRFNKVFEQLKNICSYNLEDVIKIKNDNQDILDYNYNHLLNSLDVTFNLKHKIESYFKGE